MHIELAEEHKVKMERFRKSAAENPVAENRLVSPGDIITRYEFTNSMHMKIS